MAFDYSPCYWKWFPFPCTKFVKLKIEKLGRKDSAFIPPERIWIIFSLLFFSWLTLEVGDAHNWYEWEPQREAMIQGTLSLSATLGHTLPSPLSRCFSDEQRSL